VAPRLTLVPAPSALVGRDLEQDQLAALLDGATKALVVTAEAGIGKTALLEDLRSRALDASWRVVTCGCVEAEQGYPFAALHQLINPLGQHLVDLNEHQRQAIEVALGRASGEPPAVMVLGGAVLDLLAAAAASTPHLLLVDDAHWIDEPSAGVLAFVARRLSDMPVAAAFSMRTGEPSYFQPAGLGELALRPLNHAASAELLDRTHPELPAPTRDDVLSRAAGNALALCELPTSLVQAGIDSGPQLPPLPHRLEQLFAARITALPDVERAELLRLALDGAAAEESTGGYRPGAVDRASSSGLVDVESATGRVRFRHPLVRSAVVQLATPNQVRAVHADLARRYATDPERAAQHLAAGTLDPDDAVAAALETAAHRATRRGGACLAVDWLVRAAELSEKPVDRDRRLGDAAFIAGQAGLLDRAEALLTRSDRLTGDFSTPSSVLTNAYLRLYRDGAVGPAHRSVVDALHHHGADLDDASVNRLVNLLLAISQYAADPALWTQTDTVVDEYAPRLDADTLLYRDTWGDVLARAAGTHERLAEAFSHAGGGEPWDVMRLAVSAFYLDALAEYRPYLQRMVDREGDAGAVTNVMTVLHLTVLDHTAAGRWDEAIADAERGLDLTIKHGYDLFAHQFRAYLGLVLAQRGDTSRARVLRLEVDRWARPRGVGLLTQYVDAIGLAAALTDGEYENAWSSVAGITTPGSFRPYVHQSFRTLFDVVEAAQATGRTDAARAHARAAADADLATVSPRLEMLSIAALALTDTTAETGTADTAGAMFARAVSHPAGAAHPFDLGRVSLAQGMWLRRHRAIAEARTALQRAVDLFDQLGAGPWRERATHELGLTGAPTPDARDRLAALTAQERVIADLAATGLSNKQIGAQLYLSPRTVGAHLYRIFPKLGITSRASLRDALAAAGAPDPGAGSEQALT
jgi:DNA-binding CsgD family transcriptional regulator